MTIFCSLSFTWEGGLRAEAQALDIRTHSGVIMTQKVKSWVTCGQVVVICQSTNGPACGVLRLTASKPAFHDFFTLNDDPQKWGIELKTLHYWLTAYFSSLWSSRFWTSFTIKKRLQELWTKGENTECTSETQPVNKLHKWALRVPSKGPGSKSFIFMGVVSPPLVYRSLFRIYSCSKSGLKARGQRGFH